MQIKTIKKTIKENFVNKERQTVCYTASAQESKDCTSRSMKRAGQDEEDDLLLQRENVQVGQSPFDGPLLKYIMTY